MARALLVTLAAVGLIAAGCSKTTQEKTAADLKAAGAKTGEAVKDVAQSPEVKNVGSDLKDVAHETASATKEVAGQAKVAAKDVASDVKKDTHEAKVRVQEKTEATRAAEDAKK